MKRKNERIWTTIGSILFICLMTYLAYWYGSTCNQVYLGGVKIYSRSNRVNDIKDTILMVLKEEPKWRFIPLFLISCVLHGLEYDKRRYKGIVHLVCLSALIIISAQFGYKHYNPVREPREMINVHIIMQGVMGLLYAIAYNISQTYAFKSLMKKRLSTLQPLSLSNALCFSHITGLLTAISVHLITNISLIIRYTFS